MSAFSLNPREDAPCILEGLQAFPSSFFPDAAIDDGTYLFVGDGKSIGRIELIL